MLTAPARHLVGLTVLGFVGMFVYLLGDVVFGDAGNVWEGIQAVWASVFEWRQGDLFGFMLLLLLGLGAAVTTGVVLANRDGERVPDTDDEVPPSRGSYWPLASAVGGGILVVGLVVNTQLAILGMVVLGIAALEWAVTAFVDRYSDDADANRELRDRVMSPMEIPVFAVGFAAVPVVFFSRILLAVSKEGAAVVATVVAVLVLSIAMAIYARPTLPQNAVAGLVLLVGLAIIVGGIVGAAVGEREFETHVGEHGEEHDAEAESGGGESEEGLGLADVPGQAEGADA